MCEDPSMQATVVDNCIIEIEDIFADLDALCRYGLDLVDHPKSQAILLNLGVFINVIDKNGSSKEQEKTSP